MTIATIVCPSLLAVNTDGHLLSAGGESSPGRMKTRGGQKHAQTHVDLQNTRYAACCDARTRCGRVQRRQAVAPPFSDLERGGRLAGAIASETLAGTALAANRKAKSSGPGDSRGGRILLKGGCVLSLDASVGDFETADVLIEGSKIVAVQPNLKASAAVIDASNMIVMPGFVDTHRHIWEGQLRNILPNGLLSDYQRDITGTARAVYRPEDAYAGDLVSALVHFHRSSCAMGLPMVR